MRLENISRTFCRALTLSLFWDRGFGDKVLRGVWRVQLMMTTSLIVELNQRGSDGQFKKATVCKKPSMNRLMIEEEEYGCGVVKYL